MKAPVRGDVYYLDRPQGDPHWHVVVSLNQLNQALDSILVVPLTSVTDTTGKRKDEGPAKRFRIALSPNLFTWYPGRKAPTGESLARVEWVSTFRKTDLTESCGRLNGYGLGLLSLALAYVFQIPPPSPFLVSGPISPPLLPQ
jgi:mRNA-degrading endonuclease toxin of MazEF toxin-antitoxin module